MEPGREALLNALMRSLLIVVSDVSLHQAMQLVRVPYQEEVKYHHQRWWLVVLHLEGAILLDVDNKSYPSLSTHE